MYILGLGILLFGLAFLLRNLGFLSFDANFWSVFYPIVIIVIGSGLILITHEGRKLIKHIKNLLKGGE